MHFVHFLLQNTQTTLDNIGLDNKSEQESVVIPQKRMEKQMNEDVRKMMAEIFGCIEPELIKFIGYHEKMDSM